MSILRNLYGDDIEKVDSYVGTLFEIPIEEDGIFGPILTMSTKDQLNRIRTGDRYWYENVYSEKEILEMPLLADIVKLVCDGMDKFPDNFFRVYGGASIGDGSEDDCKATSSNQISLLG